MKKHLLIILISILLLSSPVIGEGKKGETLYRWKISSGEKWMGFGHKEIHPKYHGQVENGEPSGLGIMYFPNGNLYVGEWKNGKRNGQGTYTFNDGRKYEGEWKDGKPWKGTEYDKNGRIRGKISNGK